MNKLLHDDRGMTLMELTIVSFLLVALSALLHETFRFQSQTYARQFAQSVTQTGLRIWVERMARDIRRACYDPLKAGTFQFYTIEPATIAFDIAIDQNNDGLIDGSKDLGYRWNAEARTLELVDDGNVRTLVHDVESLSFVYKDPDGVVTTLPGSVSYVEITMSAFAETGGYPGSPPPLVSQTVAAEVRNDTHCNGT